jgi:hypothetical protein
MAGKSEHLQIRVSPREKAALKRAAAAAGEDLSAYVLSRALPPARRRFAELLAQLGRTSDHRYELAELSDLLTSMASSEFHDAVAHSAPDHLPLLLQNYLAAMVEQAAYLKDTLPPPWAARVPPLDIPHFAAPLVSLRPYLLRVSPVPFRRRNIFIDASLDSRV